MKNRYRGLLLILALLLLSGCGAKDAPGGEETAVPTVTAEETEALSCCDGTVTLRFHRDENGAWQWLDDPAFPLDGQYPEELLASAAELSAQSALPESGAASQYGLDTKDCYLTVFGSDGTEQTWYFGKQTPDGGRYVRAASDPDGVYVAPARLSELMSRSIYDMALLPKPVVLSDVELRAVTVRRGDTADVLEVSDGVWTRQGRVVTEEDKIARLAAALSEVSVQGCFDYAPSEGVFALCGLEPPAAVLEVVYVNTVGVDSTLTVTVGDLRSDRQAYCVRLNGEDTVYLMDGVLPELLLAW